MDFFTALTSTPRAAPRLDGVGDVAAGDTPLTPPAGAAVRIATGAPVDTSTADLVIVPVDTISPPTAAAAAEVHVENFDAAKLHIRRKGESLKAGTLCAHTGQGIDIGLLSTLISAGIAEVEVYAAPRVAVISTGKELRPTGETLAPGKIPDSNSPMVAGLVHTWGPAHTTIAQCDDDPEKLRALSPLITMSSSPLVVWPWESTTWCAKSCSLIPTTPGLAG